VIRQRVRTLDRVEIRQGAVDGLLGSVSDGRVRGVRLAEAGGTELEADLVVDASGRGSRASRWVQELGHPAPTEDHAHAHLGYAGRLVRVPDGVLPDGLQGLGAPPTPQHTRGGVIVPAGGGRHILTAMGVLKDYPPTDEDGFLDYLRGATSPLVGQIAERCEPIGTIASYHITGSQRRRWEQLEPQPPRLLALGDAIASLNPIYAQGMSVAALQARSLRDRLAAVDGDLDALCAAYPDDLRDVLDIPWGMAASADAAISADELQGVQPPSAEEAAFAQRAEQASTDDVTVAREATRMLAWFDPTLIANPEMLARIQAWDASRRSANATDPTRAPTVTA
jgi:2-polyprenyl-6-methoxyphenol hydroxylase-like FAD-dependent oxidoreductase